MPAWRNHVPHHQRHRRQILARNSLWSGAPREQASVVGSHATSTGSYMNISTGRGTHGESGRAESYSIRLLDLDASRWPGSPSPVTEVHLSHGARWRRTPRSPGCSWATLNPIGHRLANGGFARWGHRPTHLLDQLPKRSPRWWQRYRRDRFAWHTSTRTTSSCFLIR